MNPTRCCIVCKKRNFKSNLFRIVSIKQKNIYDKGQKVNTRGIYLCKDIYCLEKCKVILQKGKLNIKIPITNDEMLKVINVLEDELGE